MEVAEFYFSDKKSIEIFNSWATPLPDGFLPNIREEDGDEDYESESETDYDEKEHYLSYENKQLNALIRAADIALESGLCSERDSKMLKDNFCQKVIIPILSDKAYFRRKPIFVLKKSVYGIETPPEGLEFIFCEIRERSSDDEILLIKDLSTGKIIGQGYYDNFLRSSFSLIVYHNYLLAYGEDKIFMLILVKDTIHFLSLSVEQSAVFAETCRQPQKPKFVKEKEQQKYLVDNSTEPPTLLAFFDDKIVRLGEVVEIGKNSFQMEVILTPPGPYLLTNYY